MIFTTLYYTVDEWVPMGVGMCTIDYAFLINYSAWIYSLNLFMSIHIVCTYRTRTSNIWNWVVILPRFYLFRPTFLILRFGKQTYSMIIGSYFLAGFFRIHLFGWFINDQGGSVRIFLPIWLAPFSIQSRTPLPVLHSLWCAVSQKIVVLNL